MRTLSAQILRFLVPALVLGAAAGATAGSSFPQCHLILVDNESLRPSLHRWTKRLAMDCPVVHQGATNSCYLQTGAEIATVYLRKVGLLGENETLSREYYFLKEIEDGIRRKIPDRPAVRVVGWGYPQRLYDLVRKHGVVTSDQFRFPRTLASGFDDPALLRKLRNSIRRKVEKEPTRMGKIKIFRELVGDLGVERRIGPRIAASKAFLENKTLRWANAKVIEKTDALSRKTTVLDEENFRVMIAKIREELDHDVPASGVFSLGSDFIREKGWDPGGLLYQYTKNHRGYSDIAFDAADIGWPADEALSQEHVIAIVGYSLDEKGEVSHVLLKNSWGTTFGENGYFTADLDFLRRYLAIAEYHDWKAIDRGVP